MDLILLKKLVALANDNPNEHEANSAARRVCKIIEEGKFDFNGDKIEESKMPYNPTWAQQRYYDYTSQPMYEDLFSGVFGDRRAGKQTANEQSYEKPFSNQYKTPEDRYKPIRDCLRCTKNKVWRDGELCMSCWQELNPTRAKK